MRACFIFSFINFDIVDGKHMILFIWPYGLIGTVVLIMVMVHVYLISPDVAIYLM